LIEAGTSFCTAGLALTAGVLVVPLGVAGEFDDLLLDPQAAITTAPKTATATADQLLIDFIATLLVPEEERQHMPPNAVLGRCLTARQHKPKFP
jgi:hypothetical protein